MENGETNSFITTNGFAVYQYRCALESLSDASSNLLLEELLHDHSDMVDDQSPNAVDNFSVPIGQMLPNKHKVRHTKAWKSKLKSFVENSDFGSVAECNNNPTRHVTNGELPYWNNFVRNRHHNPDDLSEPDSTSSSIKSGPIRISASEEQTKLFSVPQNTAKTREKTIQQSLMKNEIFEPHYSKNINSEKIQFSSFKEKENRFEGNKGPHSTKPIFKTARDQLIATNPAVKKSLGTARKTQSKFVSPLISDFKEEVQQPEITDERLKHIDPKMVELIQSEIIDNGTPIDWDDIAGLQTAKTVIQEAVVWPLLRPDIFTGLRRPPKGVLLFGPPGTGKTLIGKCVASQCHATFFNISASSLTSKWIGDGEKMVRALFAVARTCQPAVVFVDEIDSLLTQRSDAEHEATRRIKTEFLVQFDGAGTGEEDRILIIGATNRPQELDEAARRRLVKRLYIPLPDYEARKQIVSNLMRSERHELQPGDMEEICRLSEGYSGADMRSLCSEAAMGPIRSVPLSQIASVQTDQVRAVCMEDFRSALQRVRPSVSQDDLHQYVKWNHTFGFGR